MVEGQEIGDWLFCPECKSKNMYYRLNPADYVCRRCGCTFFKVKGKDRVVARKQVEIFKRKKDPSEPD